LSSFVLQRALSSAQCSWNGHTNSAEDSGPYSIIAFDRSSRINRSPG